MDALKGLGKAHWNLGNIVEAREAYEEALRLTIAAHSPPLKSVGEEGGGGGKPPDHPDVAWLLHTLGSVHARSGSPGEATRWLESSLAMKHRLYGTRTYHPEIGKTLNGLAMIRINGGGADGGGEGWQGGTEQGQVAGPESDWQLAMQMFEEAERNYVYHKHERHKHEASLGGEDRYDEGCDYADHQDVAAINENMGDLYRLNAQFDFAMRKYEEAIRVRRLWLPATTPDGQDAPETNFDENIAGLNLNVADCLLGMDKYEEAGEAYEIALKAHAHVIRKKHSNQSLDEEEDIEEVQEDQVGTNFSLPFDDHAESGSFGGSKPKIGTAMEAVIRHCLGIIHTHLGRYEKALEELLRARDIKKSLVGEAHPEVGRTLNAIGALYGTMGEKHSALAHFRQALYVFRLHAEEEGDDHPDIVNALRNITIMERSMLKDDK